MLNLVIVAVALATFSWLAFSPRLRGSSSWQATVTPLASIMGSGFLVSAPLLAGIVGNLAVFFMGALLLLAYAVGGAIRYNIRHFEPVEAEQGAAQSVALLSRLVLVAAYFISVSYYLKLLSAFVMNLVGVQDEALATWLTTAALVLICGTGAWKGLAQLEILEKYAISLNLGMIAALLLALALYNAGLMIDGRWVLTSMPGDIDLTDLRVLLGLLIVVQGFETSRYLGSAHPPQERIATMRAAQLIAAAVYIPFIGLTTVLFHPQMEHSVTEIINLVAPVASVLPVLLTLTAMGSQLSAATADVEGVSGLLEDLTRRALSTRFIYLLILIVTIALVWETDVSEIIAYASRAFALFYMLQCIVAAMICRQVERGAGRLRWLSFSGLAGLCGLVFFFGLPSE